MMFISQTNDSGLLLWWLFHKQNITNTQDENLTVMASNKQWTKSSKKLTVWILCQPKQFLTDILHEKFKNISILLIFSHKHHDFKIKINCLNICFTKNSSKRTLLAWQYHFKRRLQTYTAKAYTRGAQLFTQGPH